MIDYSGSAMRFQRRSAALRAEPVALSQAKPAAAIARTERRAGDIRPAAGEGQGEIPALPSMLGELKCAASVTARGALQ